MASLISFDGHNDLLSQFSLYLCVSSLSLRWPYGSGTFYHPLSSNALTYFYLHIKDASDSNYARGVLYVDIAVTLADY